MKKLSIIGVIAFAVIGFFTLTAGDEPMSEEQKQQMDQITQMVNEKVEAFKAEKDAECKAKAMEAAKPVADSIMAAEAAAAAAAVKSTKGAAKKVVTKKPAAKPVVKKPETIGSGKPKLGGNTSSTTVGQGKPKLGETTPPGKDGKEADKSTIGQGKPKLGGK